MKTYSWSGNYILPQSVVPNGNSIVVTPPVTSTYTLNYTSGDGCFYTQTITITVINNPTLAITPSSGNAVGPFPLNHPVTLTANGAQTYLWSGPGITPGTTTQSVVVNPHTTSKYTVIGTNGGFCSDTVSYTLYGATVNSITTRTVQVAGVKDTSQIKNSANTLTTVAYYDGLNRNIQTVVPGGSPTGKDVVQLNVYDKFGKVSKAYLPFTANQAGGFSLTALDTLTNFYSTSNPHPAVAIPQTAKPFAESIYDLSPLNRTIEKGHPGESWQVNKNPDGTSTGTGHTMKSLQDINNATEARLWRYDLTTNTATSVATYPAGTLMVSQQKDENGHYSRSYQDFSGHTLILKSQIGTDSANANYWAETHTVFDDLGHLRLIIQPEGIKAMKTANSWVLTASILNNWCFQYRYDTLGREIAKKIPGKGWMYTVFNTANLQVLSQDSMQRIKNQWSFVKYDQISRPVVTGTLIDNRTQAQLAAAVVADTSGHPIYEVPGTTAATLNYSCNAFPRTGLTYLSATYYDSYDVNQDGTPDYTYNNDAANFPSQQPWASAIGMTTAGKVAILGTSTFLSSVSFYDYRSRIIQTQVQNHLGGMDTTTFAFDFVGNVLKQKNAHTVTGQPKLTVIQRSDYDRMNRALHHWEKNNADAEVMLAAYKYTELGKVYEKDLYSTNGGSSFTQVVALRYNIRGWLTKLNDPNTLGTNLFGMQLDYDAPASGTAQYNGNVSGMQWKVSNMSATCAYKYSYDAQDRILAASSAQGVTLGAFDERSISYDLNGNILSLSRTEPTKGLVDSLAYRYTGNQLQNVKDNASTLGTNDFRDNGNTDPAQTEYTYDGNGNETKDANKGVQLAYNLLNLPDSISTGAGKWMKYLYSAAGTKLRLITFDGTVRDTTNYVNNFQHHGQVLSFFLHTEGRVVRKVDGTFYYEYHIKDHLGNLRVAFQDNGSGSAVLLQSNNYYAFGQSIAALDYSGVGTPYAYQYNGKEKQPLINWLDYGARMYDPVLARWNGVDAMAEKYSSTSMYTYVHNNPMKLVDPDGNEDYSEVNDYSARPANAADAAYGNAEAVFATEWQYNAKVKTDAIKGEEVEKSEKLKEESQKAVGEAMKRQTTGPGDGDGPGPKTKQPSVLEQIRNTLSKVGQQLYSTYKSLQFDYKFEITAGAQEALGAKVGVAEAYQKVDAGSVDLITYHFNKEIFSNSEPTRGFSYPGKEDKNAEGLTGIKNEVSAGLALGPAAVGVGGGQSFNAKSSGYYQDGKSYASAPYVTQTWTQSGQSFTSVRTTVGFEAAFILGIKIEYSVGWNLNK